MLLTKCMSSVTVSKIESQSREGCLSLSLVEAGDGCCPIFLSPVCTVDTPNGYCSCDESCYYYENCCDDILEIGCAGNLCKACFCVHMSSYVLLMITSGCCEQDYLHK